MLKENLLLGAVGIILGIGILVKTGSILFSLVPIIIGLALILFHKEEDKIEKRKDIKVKISKK